MEDDYTDPNANDHNYRGVEDISKIIAMLEDIVIKMGWDANIGVGSGDYAFGDIRIPAKHVSGFVDFLRASHSSAPLPERLKDCKNCNLPCTQTGKGILWYGKCPEFRFGHQTPSEGDLVVRRSVKDFAVLMETKLRKNEHKGHWSNESFTYLFSRLDEEMKELNQAVSSAKTDYERITDEAVDVANFLMMIVDNMKELRKQERK